MRFRQIEQLLDACTEAHTEPLATTEGDQRVRQLIALAVGVSPRVHETDDALQAVWRTPDQQHEAHHQQRNHAGEDADIDAAQPENGDGDAGNDGKGAEIRLHQQETADDEHDQQHGEEPLGETVHHRRLAQGVIGGIDRHQQLHEFGGLHGDDEQRDPAPATVHFTADARD